MSEEPAPAPMLEKAPTPDEREREDPREPGGERLAKSASAARYEPEGEPPGGAGRFWSERRVAAVLVSCVLLIAAGLLLYDIASVRADGSAAEWRRRLAHELATRELGEGAVVLTALAATLAGAWLITLAVTPGLRGLLPMRREDEDLRAGIERSAAAVVLRDRAMEVSGVRSVRVSVGRHRVRVLAESHFRDLDEVRSDLDAVLDHGIRDLGLARHPALAVHVRRPGRR
nr:DUF6286 domain-containing protein [Streptomyces hoynatensis]